MVRRRPGIVTRSHRGVRESPGTAVHRLRAAPHPGHGRLCHPLVPQRFPGAAQHCSEAQWCAADPGSSHARTEESAKVPEQRCIACALHRIRDTAACVTRSFHSVSRARRSIAAKRNGAPQTRDRHTLAPRSSRKSRNSGASLARCTASGTRPLVSPARSTAFPGRGAALQRSAMVRRRPGIVTRSHRGVRESPGTAVHRLRAAPHPGHGRLCHPRDSRYFLYQSGVSGRPGVALARPILSSAACSGPVS